MYTKAALKSFLKSTKVKMLGHGYFLNDAYELSEKFEGDELVFAENYRICLKIESAEFGITNDTVPNAKARMVHKLTAPVIKEFKNPCGRCDGTGFVPYRHIKNGICFKCEGSGIKKYT